MPALARVGLALWLALHVCANAQAQTFAPPPCMGGNCIPPTVPAEPEQPAPPPPAPAPEAPPPTTPAAQDPAWQEPAPQEPAAQETAPLEPAPLEPAPPAPSTCVGPNCVRVPAASMLQRLMAPPPRQANLARGVALYGVVSAALTLSGSIVLGVQDSERGERIGRGLMLGLNLASTPIIAISTAVVRRQVRVKGVPVLRRSVWAFFLASLVTDSLFLYQALHDQQIPLGISIAAGTTSACAVLGYAYDAFITARQAQSAGLALGVSPQGARIGLQF